MKNALKWTTIAVGAVTALLAASHSSKADRPGTQLSMPITCEAQLFAFHKEGFFDDDSEKSVEKKGRPGFRDDELDRLLFLFFQ
jgi:hypothetical protein